jgi:isoamylase
MSEDDWHIGFPMALGVFLNGEEIPNPDPRGYRVIDDRLWLYGSRTLTSSRWMSKIHG